MGFLSRPGDWTPAYMTQARPALGLGSSSNCARPVLSGVEGYSCRRSSKGSMAYLSHSSRGETNNHLTADQPNKGALNNWCQPVCQPFIRIFVAHDYHPEGRGAGSSQDTAVCQPGVKGRSGHLLAQIGKHKQPQLVGGNDKRGEKRVGKR
jgi:hypothetical protein